MQDGQRFVDSGETLDALTDEILVACPRCGRCARITRLQPDDRGLFAPRRLACSECGHAQDWAGTEIRRGWYARPIVDDFFGAALWLQARCGAHILWAYNLRHLDLLERYVGAQRRERRRDPDTGWSNTSWINRLPRWISAAKHREMVLRAIAKLRERARR